MLFLELLGFVLGMLSADPATISPSIVPDERSNIVFPTTVLYGLALCMMIDGFLWRWKGWLLLLATMTSSLCHGGISLQRIHIRPSAS